MKTAVIRGLAATAFMAMATFAFAVPPPVPIDPDIDACAECKMSVKDSGFAAEIIATDGKVYKFDDLGCLFVFEKKSPDVKAAARYVQDEGTKAWVSLEAGFYVIAKDKPTPMGYGIHAFAKKGDAEKFANALKDKPKVLGYAELSPPDKDGDAGMSM